MRNASTIVEGVILITTAVVQHGWLLQASASVEGGGLITTASVDGGGLITTAVVKATSGSGGGVLVPDFVQKSGHG